MRPRNFAFWLGSVAIAGLLGIPSAAQQAPKSGAAPCFNRSCPTELVDEAPTKIVLPGASKEALKNLPEFKYHA